MRKNQAVRHELELLYGAKCMLSDYTTARSYHHTKKHENGGKETIDNGAILNTRVHSYLHEQEYSNRQLYEELNECLILYKLCLELNETECLTEWEIVKEQVRIRVR